MPVRELPQLPAPIPHGRAVAAGSFPLVPQPPPLPSPQGSPREQSGVYSKAGAGAPGRVPPELPAPEPHCCPVTSSPACTPGCCQWRLSEVTVAGCLPVSTQQDDFDSLRSWVTAWADSRNLQLLPRLQWRFCHFWLLTLNKDPSQSPWRSGCSLSVQGGSEEEQQCSCSAKTCWLLEASLKGPQVHVPPKKAESSSPSKRLPVKPVQCGRVSTSKQGDGQCSVCAWWLCPRCQAASPGATLGARDVLCSAAYPRSGSQSHDLIYSSSSGPECLTLVVCSSPLYSVENQCQLYKPGET